MWEKLSFKRSYLKTLKFFAVLSSLLIFVSCSSYNKKNQESFSDNTSNKPEFSEDRIMFGEKSAPITIFRYVDLRSIFETTDMNSIKRLMTNYGNKIKLIVKHVPLTHLHPPALEGARILEALLSIDRTLAKQFYEKALERDVLLSINTGDDYWKLAKKLNMPIPKIKNAIAQGRVDYNILNDYAEFVRLKLTGTPTYIIESDVLVGARPYEDLEAFLKKHLK